MSCIIYAVALGSFLTYLVRYKSLQTKALVFVFAVILGNLPFIFGFSLTQWFDSVFAQPSVFLLLLSLSACFISFYAPKEVILPLKSKIFIFIFGLVLFLGALNLLGSFDIYALEFKSQLIVVAGVLFFAYMLDTYLGILLTLSIVGYLINPNKVIFSYMIDVVVWVYAIAGIIGELLLKKQRR